MENLNSSSSITLDRALKNCPINAVIANNLIIAYSKLNYPLYDSILASISGGADSDLVIDICERLKNKDNITYIWFDTGLEYQATKEHIKYLEEKYGIKIKVYKAVKPIPVCCKEYGQPFLSKQVSEFIMRLQKHSFNWEDKDFDELIEQYPNCQSALEWWCGNKGNNSRFNIQQNKWLKEFMIQNPPTFMISNKCCHYAKKLAAKRAKEEYACDLNIVGIRKAEGGVRAVAYKNCFTSNCGTPDEYRPIFWYKDADKKAYEKAYSIVHSKCYTEYGLQRTGCSGCPYGRDFEYELEVIKKYEPNLFAAVNHIFGDSYAYTRKYRQFCKEMNGKEN